MADQGLFIGWGDVYPGREQKAVEVFNNSVTYWSSLVQDGKAEDMQLAFLAPHGGDLAGFAHILGSAEQLDAIFAEDDFQHHMARAGMVVAGLGAVRTSVNEGIQAQMEIFQAAIRDVA